MKPKTGPCGAMMFAGHEEGEVEIRSVHAGVATIDVADIEAFADHIRAERGTGQHDIREKRYVGAEYKKTHADMIAAERKLAAAEATLAKVRELVERYENDGPRNMGAGTAVEMIRALLDGREG